MGKMRKTIPKGAPEFMKRIGEETDSEILEEVKKRPGSTIREIAESLEWTNGKVDGSVNRLISKGKLKAQHCFRRGMLVKKIFPADYSGRPEVVEIPRKMVDESLWKRSAYVYALSRTTIALSPSKREYWENLAVRKQEVLINRDGDNLIIELPEFFIDFYQLQNSETTLSAFGDSALLTVETTILPVDLPPTFPAPKERSITTLVFGVGAVSYVGGSPLTLRWNPTKEEEFRKTLPRELVIAISKAFERELEIIRGTSETKTLPVKVVT